MKPLVKPKVAIEKARESLQSITAAANLLEFEEEWLEFLHLIERAYNKTQDHLQKSPKYQGWTTRGIVEKLRKKDSLLSYLRFARGADQHSIQDITEKVPGGIGINPSEGDTLHINKMVIDKGEIFIDSEQPIKVTFFPGRMKLLPVTHRDRTYDPPISHLGQPLKDTDPINIGKLGLEFYENHIKDAEKYFVK